jgi:hypothetical protein
MMVRVPYLTVGGQLRVYEYAPPKRDDALARCRRVLTWAKALHRVGLNRWQSGPQGQRFQNATIEQLIATGEAVRLGDVVSYARADLRVVERAGF